MSKPTREECIGMLEVLIGTRPFSEEAYEAARLLRADGEEIAKLKARVEELETVADEALRLCCLIGTLSMLPGVELPEELVEVVARVNLNLDAALAKAEQENGGGE